jgi:ribosomal protein S12 methylthiotransferase
MLGFVQDTAFDRLGVFTYSREEGSAAYALKGQVPRRIGEKRRARIMETQAAISLQKGRMLVGNVFRAIVDEADDAVAVARIYSQAPEIDGIVLINERNVPKGEFVHVRINKAYDYDLGGSLER